MFSVCQSHEELSARLNGLRTLTSTPNELPEESAALLIVRFSTIHHLPISNSLTSSSASLCLPSSPSLSAVPRIPALHVPSLPLPMMMCQILVKIKVELPSHTFVYNSIIPKLYSTYGSRVHDGEVSTSV